MDQESLNKNQESTFTTKTEHIQRVQHENIEETKTTNSTSQSTGTADYCEGVKSFLRDLYDILVCEKLPATNDSLNLSAKTKEIDEEFFNILEILCENVKSLDCDKKSEVDDSKKVADIDDDYVIVGNDLSTNEEKIKKVARNYEKLKEKENLMKLLFHKYHPMCGDLESDDIFNQIKNFKSKNNKFIFKDLCEIFHLKVIPNIHQSLSHVLENDYQIHGQVISSEFKTILETSYGKIKHKYVPLKGIYENRLYELDNEQIFEIIRQGFTNITIDIFNPSRHWKEIINEDNKQNGIEPLTLDSMSIDKSIDFTDEFRDEIGKFEILMIYERSDDENTGTLKYYARVLKRHSNPPKPLVSSHFVRIPFMQKCNIDKFLLSKLNLNSFEREIYVNLFAVKKKTAILWTMRLTSSHVLKIGFLHKTETLTESRQILSILTFDSIENKNFKSIASVLFPFRRNQIWMLFEQTIEEVQEKTEKCVLVDEVSNPNCMYDKESSINNYVLLMRLAIEYFVKDYDSYQLRTHGNSIFEKEFEDNFRKFYEHCQEIKGIKYISLHKILQIYSLKLTFEDEEIKSLDIIDEFNRHFPQGVSVTYGQFRDTSEYSYSNEQFHHQFIANYFIAQYIVDSVIEVNLKFITENESKALLKLIAGVVFKFDCKLIEAFVLSLLKMVQGAQQFNSDIFRLINKSKLWMQIKRFYSTEEIEELKKDIDYFSVLQNENFWERFLEELENDEKSKKKDEEEEALKEPKKVTKGKIKKEIKGTKAIRKYKQDHEISKDLNEYLEDNEMDEI